MNYANYDRSIIQKWHVKLIGWPAAIPFGSPHNICTVDEVSALCHFLKDKTCYWRMMTDHEVMEHMRNTILHEADASVQLCKRKVRSDKGKRRGKHMTHQEHEKSNRNHNRRMTSRFKSRPIIYSSEDRESQSSGDEKTSDVNIVSTAHFLMHRCTQSSFIGFER
jgi:hypothetical protein